MLPSLPIIHCMPFIGAQALYKIATLDPQGGEPFGTSKKGKDIIYPLHAAPIDEVFGDTAPAEAMFVCYRRRSGGPLPRLTKACEGRIDLVCEYGAFDVDLNAQFDVKGKLSWTALGEERTEVIMRRIAAVLDALAAEDAYPICYYRSKNGLRFVHLFHEPVTVAGLEAVYKRLAPIYAKAGITPRQGLRKKEPLAGELGLLDESVTDDKILDAMAAHPVLIERPLVETDKGVRLCRPQDEVRSIL